MHTESTHIEPADWFLIANRNNLSIKVHDKVALGEDQRGILVLDADDPDQRWLTLAVDEQRRILISSQDDRCLLETSRAPDPAGIELVSGSLLQLPHNEVFVSHTLQRGQVKMEVAVAWNDTKLPGSIVISEPDSTPPEVPTKAPAIRAPATRAPAKAQKEPIEPPLLAERFDRPRPAVGSSTSRVGLMVAVAGLIILLAGILMPNGAGNLRDLISSHLADRPSASTDAGVADADHAQSEMPPLDPVSAPNATDSEVTADIADRIFTQVEADPHTPQHDTAETEPELLMASSELPGTEDATAGADSAADPVGALPSEPLQPQADHAPSSGPADIEATLSEARRLFDEGFFIWPEENTLSLVDQILTVDPTHTEALLLRDRTIRLLLESALQASADGFTEGAKAQVRDVLRYWPDYDPAIELLIDLSRKPN